jgi:hypothetical protein
VTTGRRSSSLVTDLARAGAIKASLEVDGAVTVATLPDRWVNDSGVELKVSRIDLYAGTAPVGASLTVDVLIDGTTVFAATGDRAVILTTAHTGTAVPTKTGEAIIVRPGQVVTAAVTVVGSSTAGSDLTVGVRFV